MDKIDTISIENHYFSSINLFKTSIEKTYIKIFSFETYKKMSFKNRCVVIGSNGLVSLSVPIENGRDQRLPFKEIKIAAQQPWQKSHWRTIVSCYGKSPFWEYYADYFAPFFSKEYRFLWDLNVDVWQLLWRLIDKRKVLIIEDQPVDNISLYGADVLPRNYVRIGKPVVYPQLFEERIGFQPNVSILDLLCMEGPNVEALLRSEVHGA
ncbi:MULTISPECIES: WbqC family protein [Chitinophagaceae]